MSWPGSWSRAERVSAAVAFAGLGLLAGLRVGGARGITGLDAFAHASASSWMRLFAGLLASVTALRRAVHARDTPAEPPSAWHFMAAATGALWLRDLERIRVGLSRTDDRFVVAASFVAGVVSLGSVMKLSMAASTSRQRAREMLESTLIAGGIAIVAWVAFFGDRFAASHLPRSARIAAITSPVALIGIVAATLLVLLQCRAGTRSSLVLYLVGASLITVSEAIISIEVLGGHDPIEQWGWSSAACMASLAFAWGAQLRAVEMEPRERRDSRIARHGWILWLAPSSAALAFAVPRLRPGIRDPALLGISACVILIHLAHQAVMVLENQELVDHLDLRVEQRTAELGAREHYYRGLFEHSADVIMVIGADGRFCDATPSLRRVFGWEADTFLGRDAEAVLVSSASEAVVSAYRSVRALPGSTATVQDRVAHADGAPRDVELHFANHADDPAIHGVLVTARDVTVRRELENELVRQAFHDALTGLPNRALFRSTVERSLCVARTRGHHITVLFLDLDGFKGVNDTFGHPAGDALLHAFAARISHIVRVEDTFARLGGDEFAVLLEPGVDPDSVARAIYGQLRLPFAVAGTEVHVSTSIGMADSATATTVDDLLRNADVAMYRGKQTRSQFAVRFEPAMHEAAADRLRMLADLRRAFVAGEFDVWLQPIVTLATESVIGFEALVRWSHPVRGRVAPSEFVPLAEESGLIEPLGELVLRRAAYAVAKENRLHGSHHTVSVNISVRQFENPEFAEIVEQVLRDTGLRADALVLEITESMVMRDPERACEHLDRLASIGVRIALDDFGTGYSSLAALSRYPLHVLKVDRSFVAALGADRDAASALLAAIEEIGRALDLTLIAEGVETPEERAALQGLGFTNAQGYLFGPPLPSDEALALARMPPLDAAVHS